MRTVVILIFSAGLLIGSCRRDGSQQTARDPKDIELGFENVEKELNEIYYRFPSPDEMLSFIDSSGLQFDNKLMLPISHIDNFLDSRSQAVNLGIYVADLAYITLFSRYKESMDYFQAIYYLSDNLRISAAFEPSFLDRVEKNLKSVDSLKALSNEAFSEISNFLIRNDNEKTFAYISIGGFTESLYLAINLVDDYEANQVTIQRITDQKLVLENIIRYAGNFSDDPKVEELIITISPITNLYRSLHVEKAETSVRRDADGKLILSGGKNLLLTKAQFNELKAVVNDVRNKITFTNQ
ncbi:MAG: hypothetical protein JXJ22_16920 [Bacteroidales bacterium]|nr:hypothetical protein [Bacteroidales bacterium]